MPNCVTETIGQRSLGIGKSNVGCIHQRRIWLELLTIGWIWIRIEGRGRHSRQQGGQRQAQKQKCHANVTVCPDFSDCMVLGGDFELTVIYVSRKTLV